MLAGLVVLAQLTVSVVAPDTVRWREKIPVRVVVQAPGREAPRVVAPALRGLTIGRAYEESRLEMRNGQPWVSVERRYELSARRPGIYLLGAFEARSSSERATSRPVLVHVVATGDTSPPEVVARARLDSRAHVNFRALVLPETVYVGQQASYQVGVFLDDDVRLRLRRNPEFIPPEPRSMMVYELRPRAIDMPPRVVDGVRYETHVFERALFPLSAGRSVIPKAELVYALPLTSSFFSRSETFTLRSDSLTIVALEPPEEGRPHDYQGAVGRIALAASADTAARVGDPLVLTVRVTGTGNVKLFPRPAVELPWGTSVPGEERVQIDSTASLVRGTKEFDWIVTPRQAGRVTIDPIRYPFFNPYTERYELAITAPDTLEILPGSLARSDTTVRAAVPPPALLAAGEPARAPLDRSRWYWLVAALAPLPALALLLGTRRRAARAIRRDPVALLRSLARARVMRRPADAAAVRRAFVNALAWRVRLGAAAFTHPGELAHALARAGVTTESAAAAEHLLRELDAAVFSDATTPERAATRAFDAYRAVDREARVQATLAGLTPGAFLLAFALASSLCLGATPALAQDDRSSFDRGAAAYADGRFLEAREHFAIATREAPRAAAAWANFGTASWAAGDTVNAVVGWQRALRLDPFLSDVSELLEQVPGAHGGQVSAVPLVPASAPALVAIVLWIAGWGLVALRFARRSPGLGAAGLSTLLFGAIVYGGGRAMEHAERAASLAVVGFSGPARTLPALSAESGPMLGRGEVARVVERRGVWSRVELDGGRGGWVEGERLVSLDADETAP